VNPGKHEGGQAAASDDYGQHSQAHARGFSVAELLRRMVAGGEAIRLAWRGREATGFADRSDEFPTAVLPVIHADAPPSADDDTEPTTATREARKWQRPPDFSWWQRLLAG
jgi:hypothetical protein